MGLLVAPPLEKRRNKLLTELGERLQTLETEKKIDLKTLSQHDQFVDTVLQATTYALKTSEEEKIRAFQNAVIKQRKTILLTKHCVRYFSN